MLWKRRASSDNVAISIAPSDTSEADRALDTVAALLRAYGQHAFDTEDFDAETLADECENWAERILIGNRAENRNDDAEEGPKSLGIIRDWAGVRRFVKERRRAEGDYVTRSMGNLRQAIQSFARCLSAAVADDRKADNRVDQKLGALTEALRANDTNRIRQEATSVVHTVRDAIKARRKRENQQLKHLGEKLVALRGELTEAREQAATDALTGLSNRASFDKHMERLSDLGLLFGHPPCLIMIDLDHFKQINDQHGHPGGDVVLQEVAKALTRSFLRKQDFVARFGGEEFSVLLVDTHADGAKMLIERASSALKAKPVEHNGQCISVTLSAGIASLVPGEGVERWLARADQALYNAKSRGRDRIVIA